MLDRLEAGFLQIKRFTADASHELKTPLTSIRLQLERLRPRVAPDAEATAAVGEVLEELDRVRRITHSLLFLAKAESGTLVLTRTGVPADQFVREFADDAVAMAEDGGVRFVVGRADAGIVQCEPTLIRQLLLNLATNALRISAPGSTITLESVIRDSRWRLVVSDEGPGLPLNSSSGSLTVPALRPHLRPDRPGIGNGTRTGDLSQHRDAPRRHHPGRESRWPRIPRRGGAAECLIPAREPRPGPARRAGLNPISSPNWDYGNNPLARLHGWPALPVECGYPSAFRRPLDSIARNPPTPACRRTT